MRGQLDETKLALAEVRLKLVEREQVGLSSQVAHLLSPKLHLLLLFKVEKATFVRWQYNLDWIQQAVLTLTFFRW